MDAMNAGRDPAQALDDYMASLSRQDESKRTHEAIPSPAEVGREAARRQVGHGERHK